MIGGKDAQPVRCIELDRRQRRTPGSWSASQTGVQVGSDPMLGSRLLMVVAIGLWTGAVALAQGHGEFGHFSANPLIEFLPDGRNVELKSPLEFIDSGKNTWGVPAGYRSNGASIPQSLWSIIGGPFAGAYRDASIIHDYYCENFETDWPERHKRDWRKVHRMFYDGMRARGVGEIKAKAMYGAVFYFGPRWERMNGKVRRLRFYLPGADNDAFHLRTYEQLEKRLETGSMSLEEIERNQPENTTSNFSRGPWLTTK
jgi:hypothetical protein